MAYGQDYYTLRSVFFDGTPSPVIHIHLRMFSVAHEVPIGDISSARPSTLPKATDKHVVELDIPEVEKAEFDEWLRRLWSDKDTALGKFLETNRLEGSDPVEIPLRLRRTREIFDSFCFFLPVVIWKYGRRHVRGL